MIRILLMSPYAKDANSQYRCCGPWNYLFNQNRGEVEIALANDDVGREGIAWNVVERFDGVFFHRPCRPDDITVMKVAKNQGKWIWSDFDDWLFEVPYWNPTAHIYNNPGIQNAVATAIAVSDVVSVSTSALFERFSRVNKNVVIIPNMYRSDLFPYRSPEPRARKGSFAWRGTNTHDADMLSVVDGITDLPAPIKFYGGPFWLILEKMKSKFEVAGAVDPLMYMRALYQDAPKVMLVPLVDNLFNRVKSNIAYQEALHAGALTVAPDLPEWRRPGVMNYAPGDSRSFSLAAATAINIPPAQHAEIVQAAFHEMLKLYDAPVVNKIREATLSALMSRDFSRNDRDPWDQLLPLWAKGTMLGKDLVPHGTSQDSLKAAGIP